MRTGGVARNHADALSRLGCKVDFISAIGNDILGNILQQKCTHMVRLH